MIRTLLVTACLLGGTTISAFAADTETTTETAAAHPHTAAMDKLAPLLGRFVMTGQQNEADGSVTVYEPSDVGGRELLGGTGIFFENELDYGRTRNLKTNLVFSYDNQRELYRIAALDDASGLLDIYEGTMADGMLTVTNLRADTYLTYDDMDIHYKLVWDLTDPVVEYDIDASLDGGETWLDFADIAFTPVERE